MGLSPKDEREALKTVAASLQTRRYHWRERQVIELKARLIRVLSKVEPPLTAASFPHGEDARKLATREASGVSRLCSGNV